MFVLQTYEKLCIGFFLKKSPGYVPGMAQIIACLVYVKRTDIRVRGK